MNIFLLLIVIIAGAFGTYENCRKYQLSPVFVSALMGLMISTVFLIQNFKNPFLINAFFGATFIGMSSAKIFTRFHLALACLIFLILYIKLIPFLNGMGGALGFCAFISVALSYLTFKPFSLSSKH
jgi:hypothetical protein